MNKLDCRIKGVIFDLGRTLMYLSGRSSHVDALATAALVNFLKKKGVSPGKDFAARFRLAREAGWKLAEQTEREQLMENALNAALPASDRTFSNGFLSRAVEKYFTEREKYWLAYGGAVEVLQVLYARGYLLGAVSNTENDTLMRRAVERLGFSPFLSPVITSAKAKWRKPNPHIFYMVAREWELHPSEIVMVGDSLEEDIVGAQQAGIGGILLKSEKGRHNGVASAKIIPDLTIYSLEELPLAILNISARLTRN